MSGIWANNLDMLAQAGVIDFDAPAYIYGEKPRYIGNPQAINPFNPNLPQPTLAEQPKVDEFQSEKQNGSIVKNPLWKKVLFGTLALGAFIFGGYKCKKGLGKAWNSVKNFFSGKKSVPSTPSGTKGWWGKTKTTVSNGWNSTKSFFSNGWNKFTGLFKKKP